MHSMQLRVEKDPLTGRDISKKCWNGHHQQGQLPGDSDDGCCPEEMCRCLCHERGGSAQGDD